MSDVLTRKHTPPTDFALVHHKGEQTTGKAHESCDDTTDTILETRMSTR